MGPQSQIFENVWENFQNYWVRFEICGVDRNFLIFFSKIFGHILKTGISRKF
jgi:hypothetical protein